MGTLTGLRRAEKPGQYVWDRPGEIVRCPWHGVEKDVGGLQPGLFSAEIYPTAIEASYIVVEITRRQTTTSKSVCIQPG